MDFVCSQHFNFYTNLENLTRQLREERDSRICADDEKENERVKKELEILINCFNIFDSENRIAILERKNWNNIAFDKKKGLHLSENAEIKTVISKNRQAKICTILVTMMEMITKNQYKPKRDIYYTFKHMFKSQRMVDEIVEDICCILRTTRYRLHILSTCKGLVYGNVTIKFDDKIVNCLSEQNGFTLPHDVCKVRSITSDAKFIILVEKDASFQPLIHSGFAEKYNCIIVTGKGFPDNNTRQMVRKLSDFLKIPILALVDADPYGIEIMCVYKFGSLSQAHDSFNCATMEIKWLGLHPSELESHSLHSHTQLMKEIDFKKVDDLIDRIYIKENEEYRQQLMILKSLGQKAEIQVLSQGSDYITEVYLPQKLRDGSWL